MGLLKISLDKINDSPSSLFKALNEIGFFYLMDHGVSLELQRELENQARLFFQKPPSFKEKIEMKNAGHAWRGYFKVGAELTSGYPDLKEGIYFGSESNITNLPLHGKNLWPEGSEFKNFKNTVLSYMQSVQNIAQTLLCGIAVSLGLNSNYFKNRFTDNPTILFRIFNYPGFENSQNSSDWGVQEHTDMGFLTLLLQDSSGGLEVQNKDGAWIKVPPVENSFVVNIGDMLEVWTNGIYKATLHRVKNSNKKDRLSFPFFLDPNWKTTLEPIDPGLLPKEALSNVNQNVVNRWDGLDLKKLSNKITYGEFVWNKVSKVFPNLVDNPS